MEPRHPDTQRHEGHFFPQAQLEDIQVEIPLDAVGPCKVKIEGVTVIAHGGRLVIESRDNTFAALREARSLGALALHELPRTPVVAAGINLKVKTDALREQHKELLNGCLSLSHIQNSSVKSRTVKQSSPFDEGLLNLSVGLDTDGSYSVEFNFHRDSNDYRVLRRWLEIDDKVLIDTVVPILSETIESSEKGIVDVLCNREVD